MTLAKLTEYIDLVREFVPACLTTFKGDRQRRLYEDAMRVGRANFESILADFHRGENVAHRVLLGLLPYADTPENRERGAWVHPTPAIAGDLATWFEETGWINPIDWEDAAVAILRFVERCNDRPNELADACDEFQRLPFAVGFGSSLLSPILHALRPNDFALVVNRSRWTLNYFLEESFTRTLADYPSAGRAVDRLLSQVGADMVAATGHSAMGAEKLFALFCGWLVAEKGLFKKPIPDQRDEHEPVTELSRGDAADARRVIGRLYPDSNERLVCCRLLADDIRYANQLSPANWEISLFRDRVRLNVGSTEVMVLYPHEVYMVIDGDLLTQAEREILSDIFEISSEWYENVPGNKGWGRIPSTQIDEYLHLVREPHRRLIARASAASAEPAWPGHHSPGVLDYLRSFVRRRLPDPSYAFRSFEAGTDEEPEKTVAEPSTDYREPEQTPERSPVYTIEECSRDTGIDIPTLERWRSGIERKGQAIIYGPPGTGKTYIAQRLAEHLAGGGDGFVQLVQFHPAYSYEDFVLGIRPRTRPDGALEYPLAPGRFLQFCRKAASRSGCCVLVIDEINRANLARVFGELMYLLEYRDSEIALAGGQTFSIPRNVRIIGTMNTADRSIALVDHALRRRFAMIELRPNYEVLRSYLGSPDSGIDVDGLIRTLRRINDTIDDPHYEVGISFFLRPDLSRYIEDIWTMEIEPYLQEYFFDQPTKAETFRWVNVRNDILP